MSVPNTANKKVNDLKNRSLEMAKSEKKFRDDLDIQLKQKITPALEQQLKKSQSPDDQKLLKFLIPYQMLKKTTLFFSNDETEKDFEQNLEKNFAADSYYQPIEKICNELEKHIKDNFGYFMDSIINMEEMTELCKRKKIKDSTYLTILPNQRFMRYVLLLKDLRNNLSKISTTHLESTKKEKIDGELKQSAEKIDATLHQIDDTTHLINEVKYQKEILEAFSDNEKSKALAEILIYHGVFQKHFFKPKEAKQAAKEVSKEIIFGDPIKAKEIFKKYGINLDVKAIQKIKQDYYYNLLGSDVMERIRITGAKLHATNRSIFTKIDAFLKNYRSTTKYLIHKINDSYENLKKGNFTNPEKEIKNIDNYLSTLGLTSQQKNDSMEYIKQGILEYIEHNPPKLSAPEIKKLKYLLSPKQEIVQQDDFHPQP